MDRFAASSDPGEVAMPKRRRSDDEGGRPRSRRRHHLHLVLDDWTNGYSIDKVDVADLDLDVADLDAVATPLPGPPVFRLESFHAGISSPWFSSVGGRIVMTRYNDEDDAPVLLYDTTTRGLAVGPAEARFSYEYIPNGGAQDRLYLMGSSKFHRGEDHFQVLAQEEGRWAWSPVRTPPFKISKVACHAAHPDGRTIFFSVHGGAGTYSFDTETQEWRHHGDWMLPFQGRVYYDAQLDAWVGLSDTCDGSEKGDVRSCDVVPPTGQGLQPPAWKTVREKMVCEDRERTNKVALTHMGRSRFCLVEHRFRKGVDTTFVDTVYLFYVTTFKLRYDKDGGLRATARRTRSYTMPVESTGYNWWAFGI